ncbi:DEAD/DEAH box helicase [Candidatus Sumerlaeota bacterium]|nr:DEAD/DEAH box helicase [Candidatus Sumerlaeota bacterium]
MKASDYIIEPVRLAICESIRENKGGEVFFIGKPDENLMIVDVEAHAFGSKKGVPVLLRLVEFGDVVIHNHPDGNPEPSDADVEAAAALGDLGVGSYIVDNDCKKIHILVRPFKDKDIIFLKKEDILAFYSPKGSLARNLSEYEYRPEQVSMAEAVIRAFNEDRIAVIEAGTGTGKSLAYLVPAIRWSVQNKERIVISTNTINLQEQLLNKDIPLLREKAGLKFRSELMKGRQNYICLRRLEYVHRESLWLETEKDRETFQMILDWAGKTTDGSLSDFNAPPSNDVWERVCCEPDTCLRTRCSHYEDCFFYQARRRAARADILIVNHHLLMSDLALRKTTKNYTAAAVLPPFKRIIFDEAHNVENVATSHFTIKITRRGMLYYLRRLAHRPPGHKERGLLFNLAEKLFSLEGKRPSKRIRQFVENIRGELIPDLYSVSGLVNAEFSSLSGEFVSLFQDKGMDFEENIALRITREVEEGDFWQDVFPDFKNRITTSVRRFVSLIKSLSEDLLNLSEKNQNEIVENLVEINAVREKLELAASNLDFFHAAGEDFCKWIEYRPSRLKNPESITLNIAPIDVRDSMRKAIYNVNHTIVMTSATLSVANRFDYILDLLGLVSPEERDDPKDRPRDALPPPGERLQTLQLGTSFDFDRQAFVGVATDLPDPSHPEFQGALEHAILKAVHISRGGALILFTSYRLMDHLYKALSPLIQDLGYPCFCQGSESRHKLLQKFIRGKNAVLFATASFWEGVDVKGESLKCLIITKLPFRVPTEPLLQARAEALQAEGRDPFQELDLPHAVIKFKQGFGRLIRSRTDRGAVLIFDRRVATKSYGRSFLLSLPTQKIHKIPAASLFQKMKEFFEK